MILISLMLAATTPALKPDGARPPKAVASRRANAVNRRSKRLIELEAVVRSLPLAAAEQGHGTGPQGL